MAPTSWASAGATRCSGDPSPTRTGLKAQRRRDRRSGVAQHRNHHHGREATFSNNRSCRDRRIGNYGLRNAYGDAPQGMDTASPWSSICRTDTQSGATSHGGRVSGTYIHGLFASDDFRHGFLRAHRSTVIRTHSHGIKVWMKRWTVWRTTYNPASTPRKLLR